MSIRSIILAFPISLAAFGCTQSQIEFKVVDAVDQHPLAGVKVNEEDLYYGLFEMHSTFRSFTTSKEGIAKTDKTDAEQLYTFEKSGYQKAGATSGTETIGVYSTSSEGVYEHPDTDVPIDRQVIIPMLRVAGTQPSTTRD